MEVVLIKKLLVWNLLIFIGLHCVKRLLWIATTLATLILVDKSVKTASKKNLGLSIVLALKIKNWSTFRKNNLFFRLQLSENVSNKKLAPKLAFLNGKKEEIIRWFFDIWNWLWSSEFSYLWPSKTIKMSRFFVNAIFIYFWPCLLTQWKIDGNKTKFRLISYWKWV